LESGNLYIYSIKVKTKNKVKKDGYIIGYPSVSSVGKDRFAKGEPGFHMFCNSIDMYKLF